MGKTIKYTLIIVFIICIPIIFFLSSCGNGKPINEDISEMYYIKGEKIYCQHPVSGAFPYYRELEGVDAKSFVPLSQWWGKDKHAVYYEENRYKNSEVDLDTFTVSNDRSEDIVKDKNHVYFIQYIGSYPNSIKAFKILEQADPDTYLIVDSSLGKWARDKNYVFLNNKLFDADCATFRVIKGGRFAYDKDNVYAILPSNDLWQNEIKRIPANTNELVEINSYYVRTNTTVYFCKYKNFESFPIHDTNTLKILFDYASDQWLKVDGQMVCNGKPVPDNSFYGNKDIDVDSFELIEKNYLKDKNHIYSWQGSKVQVLPNADIETFTVLESSSYAKDKANVYYSRSEYPRIVPNSDAETFTVFGASDYAKDKNHVYYRWYILEGANPETFSFDQATQKATDGKHFYRDGKLAQ